MDQASITRDIFMGFVKLHLLHHSAKEEIFGLDMIQELGRHGYSLSPGTLYPLLHKMEEKGYLVSRSETMNGKVRKYYRITAEGRKVLKVGLKHASELLDELKE